MTTIYIDNRPYEVAEGQNLLRACLSLGFNLPYFCWHPAMHSVGACRQCAVKQFKDENDTKGRIVMACMTPASEGTRISIDDPEAKAFRAGVIELLMVNHPHDCPVCDEGGECHLQDMTLMTGHTYRRYRFAKRTHRNQDLGPFVTHEMNRCIACYRCVRFYRDYAGGRDFDVFQWHNNVYFGRQSDGVLENEFSGNLVEVCPTGVFTDKTLARHYARKWDLQTAPSICVHCSVGCNTIPGERYGRLRRIRNRYNREVNGYFLCDRGRYGYEFVNGPQRIRRAMFCYQPETAAEPFGRLAAIERARVLLEPCQHVLGIGSPRASLEANFALWTLVGPDNFYRGVSAKECRLTDTAIDMMRSSDMPAPSLHDVERSDAVLVLGEDLTNTAPMLALAVRHSTLQREIDLTEKLHIHWWDDAAIRVALQQRRGPLFVATPAETKLDDVATHIYHGVPDDLVRFAQAIAEALTAPIRRPEGMSPDLTALVEKVAETLYLAQRPVIVSGVGCGSEELIRAAANIAKALGSAGRRPGLAFAFPECNSVGLGLLGGGSLEEACRVATTDRAAAVVVLENNLFRRVPEPQLRSLVDRSRHLIAIDHEENETTDFAEIVFPSASFAESDGTLVNYEGRAQRFFRVLVGAEETQESWRWIWELLPKEQQAAHAWESFDGIQADLAQTMPAFAPILQTSPRAVVRIVGQKIARQHARFSGRTAIHTDQDVRETPPPVDRDSPLTFSMEGYQRMVPLSIAPRQWAPGWNSPQALPRFQEELRSLQELDYRGQTLIARLPSEESGYFASLPPAFERRPDEWLLISLYHIFGAEELSVLAPAIAQLTPPPYLALHPDDADELGLDQDDEVEVKIGGQTLRLASRWNLSLARGVAGISVGLPGVPPLELPVWAGLKRVVSA